MLYNAKYACFRSSLPKVELFSALILRVRPEADAEHPAFMDTEVFRWCLWPSRNCCSRNLSVLEHSANLELLILLVNLVSGCIK